MDHVQDLPLICLMLLDIFPNLDIRGVDYIDQKLLEGTEHEHLLKEIDELNLLVAGTTISDGAENPEVEISKKTAEISESKL